MSYAHTEVAQIAAISSNRCIGKNNELPWHISADLQHFKSMTTKENDSKIQGIVIMGRKTFESMGSKPLPQAASLAHGAHLDTIWVIGGERVFSDALMYTDRIELTHVDTDIADGDAFYPELPERFKVADESEQMDDEKSDLSFKFTTYKVETDK